MTQTILQMFGMRQVAAYTPKGAKDVSCSNPDLIVGLELETENCRDHGFYVERVGNGWMVAEDGSLRPRGSAWEFISKPTRLAVMMHELPIFFDKFKFDDSNYSDRCSVHVHTNVQDFTQEQLANLALVYTPMEPVLFQFVNHFNYKKDKQGACRDTNLYCIPWSQCRMNSKLVDRIFASPGDAFHRWQKYTALNLLPIREKGTVEWRHMHGTADMEKLGIWLNMIGSIMLYAKNTPFADVLKTIKTLNDTSAYQQFFTAVLGKALPYDPSYEVPLSEGVINAKYSLIDYESRLKGKLKKEKGPYAELLGALARPMEVQETPQAVRGWAIADDVEETTEERPGWFAREADRLAARQREQAAVAAPTLRVNTVPRQFNFDTVGQVVGAHNTPGLRRR